jgi:hypothetical protein
MEASVGVTANSYVFHAMSPRICVAPTIRNDSTGMDSVDDDFDLDARSMNEHAENAVVVTTTAQMAKKARKMCIDFNVLVVLTVKVYHKWGEM